MTTEDTTTAIPIRPLMQIGSVTRRRAANTNTGAKPLRLRANDTIRIGDLLIMVQTAVEESRDTGRPFGECLVEVICEDD